MVSKSAPAVLTKELTVLLQRLPCRKTSPSTASAHCRTASCHIVESVWRWSSQTCRISNQCSKASADGLFIGITIPALFSMLQVRIRWSCLQRWATVLTTTSCWVALSMATMQRCVRCPVRCRCSHCGPTATGSRRSAISLQGNCSTW